MTIRVLVTCFCIFLSGIVFSQSSEDMIRHTIQNYFNGTSYNYLDQINAAFHPDAKLYLENKEGKLWPLTTADYVGLFKGESGKFNGRYNKILSIDIEGNLALVKAEILVPARNRRYVDVFIVREMEAGKWQIVSKAANSSAIKEE